VQYQVIHGDTETDAPWAALDEFLQLKFKHESGAPMRILADGRRLGFPDAEGLRLLPRRVASPCVPGEGHVARARRSLAGPRRRT
jgi:hypothetical protein